MYTGDTSPPIVSRRRRRGAIIVNPDVLVDNLELEDGSNLLWEDGGFILLES